jgi:hypothetical protein
MVEKDALKEVLHRPGINRKSQILLCLGVEVGTPKRVADIKKLAEGGGLKRAKSWNISAILSKLSGRAVRTPDGWELTEAGKSEVRALLGIGSPVHAVALKDLRTQSSRLKSALARPFVDEAIGCAEAGFHRAAVVLSWVGATATLYDHVVSHHINAFNTEAKRRDARWKDARNEDDLTRMKEHEFLQVLAAISILGKNVKDELEGCLKLRNGCGHPNSLQLAESRVAAHIETLVLNVFSVFA